MTDTLREGWAETLNQDPCPSPMLSSPVTCYCMQTHHLSNSHFNLDWAPSRWQSEVSHIRHGEDVQEWHLHSFYLHAQLTWPVLLPRSLPCCEFPHTCNSQLTSFLRQKYYPSPISSTYCTFCLAQPVVCLLCMRHRRVTVESESRQHTKAMVVS